MPCKAALAVLLALATAQDYPSCAEQGIVLRHAGAHAIFVDLASHGPSGCWQNDCKNTDKFNAEDQGVCARLCSEIEECNFWTFGEQEGARKCFFRRSDGGREQADGWVSAAKGCAPAALPPAFVALRVVESDTLAACDNGRSDDCQDLARAVKTWQFAIQHLVQAAEGQLDDNTMQYVRQIAGDMDALAREISEENYPIVIANNRQVFGALRGWLDSAAKADLDTKDMSLPSPLRGKLCGRASCYEL